MKKHKSSYAVELVYRVNDRKLVLTVATDGLCEIVYFRKKDLLRHVYGGRPAGLNTIKSGSMLQWVVTFERARRLMDKAMTQLCTRKINWKPKGFCGSAIGKQRPMMNYSPLSITCGFRDPLILEQLERQHMQESMHATPMAADISLHEAARRYLSCDEVQRICPETSQALSPRLRGRDIETKVSVLQTNYYPEGSYVKLRLLEDIQEYLGYDMSPSVVEVLSQHGGKFCKVVNVEDGNFYQLSTEDTPAHLIGISHRYIEGRRMEIPVSIADCDNGYFNVGDVVTLTVQDLRFLLDYMDEVQTALFRSVIDSIEPIKAVITNKHRHYCDVRVDFEPTGFHNMRGAFGTTIPYYMINGLAGPDNIHGINNGMVMDDMPLCPGVRDFDSERRMEV